MTFAADTELIENFLNGDINSFNRLVHRWQNRLYSFAYRYVMNEQDAKEIVQSALIKAYKNLNRLKEPEKFSSWIFQITVNLCKDHLKRNSKNRYAELTDDILTNGNSSNLNNAVISDSDPVSNINQLDLSSIIKRSLAQLSEEQRVVIIMKEYEGFKFSEIAEMLNVPLSTVKSRMYYGITQMQKILKKLNIDEEVVFNEM
ncbi:RNA polymerase sigma factor [candidate division KSB1 bacterium]